MVLSGPNALNLIWNTHTRDRLILSSVRVSNIFSNYPFKSAIPHMETTYIWTDWSPEISANKQWKVACVCVVGDKIPRARAARSPHAVCIKISFLLYTFLSNEYRMFHTIMICQCFSKSVWFSMDRSFDGGSAFVQAEAPWCSADVTDQSCANFKC